MTLATWLTFFVASWLISLSPGAGAISCMAAGLRYGHARAMWNILGLQIGVVFILVVVAAGLGAVLAASTVAFEATGIYWLPLYHLLSERGFEVVVVNPRDTKALRKKTDIADAATVDESIRFGPGLRLPILAPMENADMVGLDLTLAIHDYILPHLEASPEPSPLLREKATFYVPN